MRPRSVALALLVPVVAAAGCGDRDPATRDRPNAVAVWSAEAERAIIRDGRQPPWRSPITLATVHVAVFDAVNAIDRRDRPFTVALAARGDESRDAAVAGAAHGVLVRLLPAARPRLDAVRARALGAVRDRDAARRGALLGASAAAAVLESRAADGTPAGDEPVVDPPAGGPVGRWRATPPERLGFSSRWVGDVRPFVAHDVRTLRTPGPNRPGSRAFARDFAEVAALGGRARSGRSAEQTALARFWSDDMMTSWGRVLRTLTAGRDLSVTDAARTYAMATTAAADGAIACWRDKARWSFWRPVTAVRQAARDGDPRTRPDREWTPLLDTPPFPEHPSGHACIGAALAGATARALGTDRVSFALRSPATGETRRYRRLSAIVDEVADARVYAGAHFRAGSDQGTVIGRGVVRRLAAGGHFTPLPAARRARFTHVRPSSTTRPGHRR